MRVANNGVWTVGCALAAVAAAACAEDPAIGSIVVRVAVAPAQDTVPIGLVSTRLGATAFNVHDETVDGADVTWRSDQPFIAGVDSLTGAVTGVATGVAAITATVGRVSDTAEVFVVPRVSLSLPLDTILLAAGDTFTVPVDLIVRDQSTPPAIAFSGGAPGIATIDPSTGLVTATSPGVVGFTVTADTLATSGAVEVWAITDTTFGIAYFSVRGAVSRTVRLGARWFNHATDAGGSVTNMAARTTSDLLRVLGIAVDSVGGPGTRPVGEFPATLPSSLAVCQPPNSWVVYQDLTPGMNRVARSVGGAGDVAVTTFTPIPGGATVSARLDLTLQLDGVAGAPGVVSLLGTMVVPVVTLSACPG